MFASYFFYIRLYGSYILIMWEYAKKKTAYFYSEAQTEQKYEIWCICCCIILLTISAFKWLIASLICIFFLHNICMCTLYINVSLSVKSRLKSQNRIMRKQAQSLISAINLAIISILTWPYSVNIKDIKVKFTQYVLFHMKNDFFFFTKNDFSWVFTERVTNTHTYNIHLHVYAFIVYNNLIYNLLFFLKYACMCLYLYVHNTLIFM